MGIRDGAAGISSVGSGLICQTYPPETAYERRINLFKKIRRSFRNRRLFRNRRSFRNRKGPHSGGAFGSFHTGAVLFIMTRFVKCIFLLAVDTGRSGGRGRSGCPCPMNNAACVIYFPPAGGHADMPLKQSKHYPGSSAQIYQYRSPPDDKGEGTLRPFCSVSCDLQI